MVFFQTCNLTAILTVYHEYLVGYENEISFRISERPQRLFWVSLVLKWSCGTIVWLKHPFLKRPSKLTMLFIALLLVAALAQNNDEGKLKITSLESDVTKNPTFLAVKVSFLILVEYVELPNHAETYFCFFLAPFLRMTTSALMLLKTKTNSLPCA